MKLFAGVLIGIGVALSIIFIVESVCRSFLPLPANFKASDFSAAGAMPIGLQISDAVAWTLGIFGGGLVGGLVAGRKPIISWIVALIVFGLAALSFLSLPYDSWIVQSAGVAIVFAAGLASWYARKLPNLQ